MATPLTLGSEPRPAWAGRVHARRLRAARLTRLLADAAQAAGLYPSAELRVALAGEVHRPLVCVAAGHPPVDGVLRAPPVLVLETAGTPVAAYLAGGTRAAWLLGPERAERHLPGGRVERLHAGDTLGVPGWPRLRLPVAAAVDALGGASAGEYGLVGNVR